MSFASVVGTGLSLDLPGVCQCVSLMFHRDDDFAVRVGTPQSLVDRTHGTDQ
jgi:hypothetical protein